MPVMPLKKSHWRVSYPHRLSLDLNPAQYEWLKEMAWEKRESASGLLRPIIDQFMSNTSQLQRIIEERVNGHAKWGEYG